MRSLQKMGFPSREQRASNAPVPIGGMLPIVDAASPLVSIHGQDYLKSSVLAPIEHYRALTANPWLTNVVGERGSALLAGHVYLGFAGGYYYSFVAGNDIAKSCTDLASWANANISNSGATHDYFTFGAKLIWPNASAYVHVFSAGTSAVNVNIAMYCGAANAAATLGVLCFNTGNVGGNIYTTTDGTTWTARTPTGGGAGSPIFFAAWCPASGKFIYIAANGRAYTAVDGYTLTDAGALIAGATWFAQLSPACLYSASSATSTLFVINTNLGVYIVRTMNGAAYTCMSLRTLLGLDAHYAGGVPYIHYSNETYFLLSGAVTGSASMVCHKSVDDGVTWTKAAVPYAGGGAVKHLARLNNLNVIVPSSSGAPLWTAVDFVTPTHVGIVQAAADTTAGGAAIPKYVRLK